MEYQTFPAAGTDHTVRDRHSEAWRVFLGNVTVFLLTLVDRSEDSCIANQRR